MHIYILITILFITATSADNSQEPSPISNSISGMEHKFRRLY